MSTLGVAQGAIAVLLLASAGLLARSFLRLQSVDPGFDARNLVVLMVPVPRTLRHCVPPRGGAFGFEDPFGEFEFFHPWPQTSPGWGPHSFAIRTAGDPAPLIPLLKQRAWAVDPKLPISESLEMRARIAESIARPRFFFVLMTVFASVAAAVAAVGVYGLFSYLVARRTHEIGIRLAVGATPRQVGRLVLRQAVVVALTGALLGLAASWATARAITSLLFQTSPTDPMALAGGAATLLALAIVACYVPARRAQRVDPLVMLKVEQKGAGA